MRSLIVCAHRKNRLYTKSSAMGGNNNNNINGCIFYFFFTKRKGKIVIIIIIIAKIVPVHARIHKFSDTLLLLLYFSPLFCAVIKYDVYLIWYREEEYFFFFAQLFYFFFYSLIRLLRARETILHMNIVWGYEWKTRLTAD